MSAPPIAYVTGNQAKLREVRRILGATTALELEAIDVDLPEYQGTSDTVTREKCKLAASILGRPVLIEDTSLGFNALNGLPGPYIKWFSKSLGDEGLVKMLEGFHDKSAFALCTYAYSAGPDQEPILFHGRTNGTIVAPRGNNGFAWNAIFQPEGSDKTYAEMTDDEKNAVSHRGRGLALLVEHFGGGSKA
ncbi:inosine triphosphate pyrophosphatase [Blastocladiella britannica]|nr:inosine triphosphate pyrophosphatase [Blastocladiella britannica]